MTEGTSHTPQILITNNFLPTFCNTYDMWVSSWSITQITSTSFNNLLYSLLISDFEMPLIKSFIPGGTLKEIGALLQNIHVQELI